MIKNMLFQTVGVFVKNLLNFVSKVLGSARFQVDEATYAFILRAIEEKYIFKLSAISRLSVTKFRSKP